MFGGRHPQHRAKRPRTQMVQFCINQRFAAQLQHHVRSIALPYSSLILP